jgi:quinol-cytochrome oxidoreductase complex cytochrome b subunit
VPEDDPTTREHPAEQKAEQKAEQPPVEDGGSRGARAVVRDTEVYRSVIRRPSPNRTHNNFLFHIYPVRVPERVLSLKSTGRLGFISSVLFVILTITGTYLMFFYRPQMRSAYFDMHEIHTQVVFGQVVRNMHRWSAHLMVVVVFIHMIRVFWSGAYKRPRQFNWVIGIGLLLLTLFLSFTGYLLPWDQLALWAVTVGTNLVGYMPLIGEQVRQVLLGSPDVGDPALIRFYTLHIYVLPLLTILLMAVHIWRVRKDGFAVGDREPEPEPEPATERASDE